MKRAVNQEDALTRLGQNKSLYIKISKKFIIEFSDVEKVLSSRHESGKFREVAIIAHTLKGISGSLGAGKLQEICSEIETRINSTDGPDLSKLLENFNNETQKVRNELEKFIEQES